MPPRILAAGVGQEFPDIRVLGARPELGLGAWIADFARA